MAKEMNKTEKMRKLFADKALDTEQMENVAGGVYHETADDSRFLNVLLQGHPAQPDRYGEKKLQFDYANNGSRYAEIRAAWQACGVQLAHIGADDKDNTYYIGGKQVTHDQARQHAMNVMGRQLKHSDWYWD